MPNDGHHQQTVTPVDEVRLVIESIGIDLPVVVGEQPEIDAGHVVAVHYSAQSGGHYPDSCLPGDGCLIWLAAHRSTHGATFARVPELAPGDVVVIVRGATGYAYEVYEREIVPAAVLREQMHGDLLIQTSWHDNTRIFVHATSIGQS